MKMYWRILTLILIVWLMVASLFWLAIGLVIFYLYHFRGYELILIGILIDGYYHYFYEWPVVSLTLLGIVILADLIKPHLLMYNGKNEMV